MNDHPLNDTPSDRPAPAEGTPSVLSRRRLLRAGAAATPVVLTLASTPVAATTGTCTVASSFVSAATFKSRNPNASAQCTTWGCEAWKSQCTNGSTTFNSTLDSTVAAFFGTTNSNLDSRTIRSILNDAGGIVTSGDMGVLQHLSALRLGLTYAKITSPGNVTNTYVKGVWTNYRSNGGVYILSGSGINWSSADVVTWARMLMYTNN
ncbi:MAG: hypothetical protein ACK5QH_09200 [Rubrivivax sp.]